MTEHTATVRVTELEDQRNVLQLELRDAAEERDQAWKQRDQAREQRDQLRRVNDQLRAALAATDETVQLLTQSSEDTKRALMETMSALQAAHATAEELVQERNYARARAAKLAACFVAIELCAAQNGVAEYDEIHEAYQVHATERDL